MFVATIGFIKISEYTNLKLNWENQPSGNIEPIPALLQGVIDHLIQWNLISERRPNSCVINYFDEVHIYLCHIHVGICAF